jgi:hypothetical protein
MFIFLKTLGNFINVGTVLEIMVVVNAQFYLSIHHQKSIDGKQLGCQPPDLSVGSLSSILQF